MPAAVTAVVPTRNRRDVLALTLGTILAQRDVELSVVVVDEASTDGTAEYLRELRDDRIEVVTHAVPKGLAGARNAGIGRVRTRWVACCDDDDLWAPDKLARQLAAIDDVPGARWACTGTVSIDGERAIVGHLRPPEPGDHAQRLRTGNIIPGGGSSVLADVELVRQVGGFDPWPTGVEDYDMWVRLGQESPLATVDLPLVGYRVWPGSMSTNVERMRTGRRRVVERHRRDVDPEAVRAMDLRHRQYLARFHLKNRDRVGGFRDYLDIAVRYRLPSHAAHAVSALVAPGLAERRRARQEREAVPRWWADAAEAWLREVRPALPAVAS